MQDLSVTIIQSNLVWEDTEANLTNFDGKLSQIDNLADLIVLPEMFSTGFSINPKKISEKPDGRTFCWMQEWAAKLSCVVTGSVLIDDNGKYFNRLFWVCPDGSFDYYDKRHLFRLGEEYKVFSAGQKRIIFELNGWKIFPQICYDLRFPVWSKNRYLNNQYEFDLMIYVANWPEVRGHAWKQLLIARAIENQACVVGVNRVGRDGKQIPHSGDSLILDFKGQILVQANPHKEETITTQISYSEMKNFREQFTVGLDWDGFEIKDV
jgi:predicted amidohydrolase